MKKVTSTNINTPFLGVSLWLEPKPDSFIKNSLQDTIRSLQPLFDDAPHFSPHLTITSQINIDPNSQEQINVVLNAAKVAASSVPRIDVLFNDIVYGSKFFKKVYLEAAPSMELVSLARICREEFVILPQILISKRRLYAERGTKTPPPLPSSSQSNATTTTTTIQEEPPATPEATKNNENETALSDTNRSSLSSIPTTPVGQTAPTLPPSSSSPTSNNTLATPTNKTRGRSRSFLSRSPSKRGKEADAENAPKLGPPLSHDSAEYKQAVAEAAHQAAQWASKEFDPHVSLVYSSRYPIDEALQSTINSRLNDVFGESVRNKKVGFRGSRLSLVLCEGPVESWKVLGYRDF